MDNHSNELKLVVPDLPSRREAIINAAREIVSKSSALPPVEYEELYQLATMALSQIEGTHNELAFTILLCNNEVWRPYFEATPYERRLLLIPQCLKNSKNCKAITDELGLICAGCNGCSINSIIDRAEKLGYQTLIAEGTSVALALVEEGAVDAILGVSCMETLQKSFSKVFSSAMPSVAIPLLYDGCSDTKVDMEWLSNVLVAKNDNKAAKPISVLLLKKYVENLFTRQFLNSEFGLISYSTHTAQMAVDSMLQGGKRMRPLLTLMAYSAYSNRFDQTLIDRLLLAVECFHKASLIHDDIEDHDDYRYDKKTAHHQHGIPLAINLGDYLIGQGYRTISQLPVNNTILSELFALFSGMHVQSTIGQGEELLLRDDNTIATVNDTLTIFSQKSGSAIRVALLAGAIVAQAPENDLLALSEFSSLFGIAYQIRDDLTEFNGTASDQQTASFPFLKSLLIEAVPANPAPSDDWRILINKHGIDTAAQSKLDNIVAEIRNCLNRLSSLQLRLAFLNMVNQIFGN